MATKVSREQSGAAADSHSQSLYRSGATGAVPANATKKFKAAVYNESLQSSSEAAHPLSLEYPNYDRRRVLF